MNEYGEIVRSGKQSSNTSSNTSSASSNGNLNSFSSEVMRQFLATKKKNFNLITLAIGIPLYAIIGYFLAEYFQYQEITGEMGAIIGGSVALIGILIYNNVWAKMYEGYEYLIALLFTGIALVAVAVLIFVLYVVVSIVLAILGAIFTVVIAIAIIAGLAGG